MINKCFVKDCKNPVTHLFCPTRSQRTKRVNWLNCCTPHAMAKRAEGFRVDKK